MPHFIKTGFWEKAKIAKLGWLNLDRLVLESVTGQFVPIISSTTILENTSTIDLSSSKASLISGDTDKTFTISYLGDDITLEVTLNNTSATYIFPEESLCVSEGISLGNNILSLSGVSGDKYIIGIKKINNSYYIVSKNFGQ